MRIIEAPDIVAETFDIREHSGYSGVFTRHQYEAAEYKNGTRIKKVWGEAGDGTALGTKGTVLGSLGHPNVGVAYFVEWDDKPHHAVFVAAKKLGAVTEGEE